MKAYEGVETWPCVFSTLEADGGKWSGLRPSHITSRKKPPYQSNRRLVGPKTSLAASGNKKSSCPFQEWHHAFLGCPARSKVWLTHPCITYEYTFAPRARKYLKCKFLLCCVFCYEVPWERTVFDYRQVQGIFSHPSRPNWHLAPRGFICNTLHALFPRGLTL